MSVMVVFFFCKRCYVDGKTENNLATYAHNFMYICCKKCEQVLTKKVWTEITKML